MADQFDLPQILRQVRDIGGKLKQIQESLRHRTVEVTVGGGMVTAVVNGRLEVTKITIDPQAVDPRDVDMLQDLIVAAVNEAMRRAQKVAQEELQQATGLPIGSLMQGLTGPGDPESGSG